MSGHEVRDGSAARECGYVGATGPDGEPTAMSEGLTIVGLALALLSALAWSGLDAARKSLAGHLQPLPAVVLLTWGQVPLFVAWLVASVPEGAVAVPPAAYWLPGLASVAGNVVANLLFMVALRLSPLSATVPLLAFVPVFATLVALPLLGELPTPSALVGIALVVGGALALNANRSTRGLSGLVRGLLAEKGSLPMLGVSLCWGLSVAFDKLAIAYAPPPVHALALNLGVGVVLLAWLVRRGQLAALGEVRFVVGPWLLAVVFAGLALAAQLVALGELYIGILEAIKRFVGLAMAVVLGRMLFAESISASKLAGVALMAIGAAVVVLGQ